VDNYDTHTSHLITECPASHPDIVFHFTPSHGSWLNQVELMLSILYRRALQKGDFKSKQDLAQKLVQFIERYNKGGEAIRVDAQRKTAQDRITTGT